MRSLKDRLAGNVLANIFSQGSSTFIQLISVPLFLAFWTKEQYGAWILVSSIPTYLTLAEAGFATASANEVSMFIAAGNFNKARRALHSVWGFLLAVSLFACVALVPLSFLPPWGALLNIASYPDLSWVIFLLGIYSILGLASSVFSVMYRAAYAAPRQGVLTGLNRLAELAAIAASIAWSPSMLHLAMALLLVRVATSIYMMFDVRRLSPDLLLGLAEFSLAEIRRIWRPSMMFLAGALGNGFYYQGLTLLVGSLLGPAAVVAFNATRTLTRAIAQYANTIRSSTWPEFSYLHGSRDLVRARRLAEFSLEVTGVGSLVLFGLLYWGAPVIMPLWTYGAVSADPHLVAVLLLGAVLNALALVVSAPLAAANRHQWIAALYLLGSAVSLVAGYGLIQWLKLPGVAWSMVLCELLTLPFTIISACRVLDCTASEMLGGVLRMRSSWNEGLRFLKRRYAGQPSSRAR